MDDLVKRLRAVIYSDSLREKHNHLRFAADRIEQLEAVLREIRQSTTLYGAQTKARTALEEIHG